MTTTTDPAGGRVQIVQSGCLDADSLLAFVDGTMDDSGRSRAESHLSGCPLCSDLVAAAADGDPGRSLSAMAHEDPGVRLTPGTALGRYVILDAVGRGGTSEVYAAYDRRLDRRVALKLLHQGAPALAAEPTARAKERMLREAKAIARLSHPNVVVVYDAGEIDDRVFLAMEFIEGRTLAAWLAAERRGWREVVRVFADAARGLAAAHRAGIVHRDFKPQNVMVGDDGVVRVMDFGLARDRVPRREAHADAAVTAPATAAAAELTAHTLALTRLGDLIGTPLYMAPEQFRAEAADGRTDQFGFCVALYEALYGERPFAAESLPALREAVMKGAVREPPRGNRIPTWLRHVVLRGLRPDRGARFPSMESLLGALGRDPGRALRRFGVAAALGLIVVGGVLFLRQASLRDQAMCHRGADRVAGIWDPPAARGRAGPRRAAIAAAFAASGRPYATAIAARVGALLDRYVADWTGMYTEACEATRVRGDQSEALLDLRMTCLGHRLSGLRALTDLFVHADAAMVDKSVDAVFALPPVDACADVRSLQAASPAPDPAVRARVEELRQRLAEAKALGDAGRLREARERSRPLVVAARALGYGPLVAEAQLESAFEAYINYDAEAESEASKALLEGEAHGQDEVVATAAVMLRYILVSKAAYAEAWRYDDLAEAALRRIGGHPRLRVWLLDSRAGVFGDQGRYVEALKTAEESAALAESKLGPDHRDVAVAMNSKAIALNDLGRPAEALAALDRALGIFTRDYGPGNPFLAIPLSNRGEMLSALGRHDEAIAEFRKALDQMTRNLGPDHPHLAFPLTGLGSSLLALGRAREAIPLLERAVKLRTTNPTRLGRLQDSQLALAKALWDTGTDRRRALTLAQTAEAGYAATPSLQAKAADAREWLQQRHRLEARFTPLSSRPANGGKRPTRQKRGG